MPPHTSAVPIAIPIPTPSKNSLQSQAAVISSSSVNAMSRGFTTARSFISKPHLGFLRVQRPPQTTIIIPTKIPQAFSSSKTVTVSRGCNSSGQSVASASSCFRTSVFVMVYPFNSKLEGLGPAYAEKIFLAKLPVYTTSSSLRWPYDSISRETGRGHFVVKCLSYSSAFLSGVCLAYRGVGQRRTCL